MHNEEFIAEFREKISNNYVTEALKRFEMKPKVEPVYKKGKDTKFCKKCGKYKPLNQFYYNPLKYKKCSDYCKECVRKRQKAYRERIKNA